MPVYACRVVDSRGRSKRISRESVSEEMVLRDLSQSNLYPLSIEETKQGGKKRGFKITARQLAEFTETIALLLSSGLMLKDALEIARDSSTGSRLQKLCSMLLGQIEKGGSLHEAVKESGMRLPNICGGLFRIGEKLGSLERTFTHLSSYLTQERKLKEKLVSAMIYPGIVLGVAIAGVAVIATVVLPRIAAIFAQIDTVVPVRIDSVVNGVKNVAAFVIVVSLALIGISFIRSFSKKREGKTAEVMDGILLKIPIIGKLEQLRASFKFSFAMESLTGGGYSLEDALEEASGVVGNCAYRAGILRSRESILNGDELSRTFLTSGVFPERLSRWIAVGDRSGRLEAVFSQLRKYYQAEMEKWSSRFMSLIEPMLILLVGGAIFIVIIIFVVPILSIYGSI